MRQLLISHILQLFCEHPVSLHNLQQQLVGLVNILQLTTKGTTSLLTQGGCSKVDVTNTERGIFNEGLKKKLREKALFFCIVNISTMKPVRTPSL